MFKKIISSLVLLGLLVAVPVQAQTGNFELPNPGITPDSPFFFLDQWGERISGLFATGAEAKTKQAFNNAQERLSETKKLSESKPEGVDKALKLYQKEFKKASDSVASSKSEKISKLVSEATTKHLSVLEEVEDKVPEPAKEAVKNARKASTQGQINALNALSSSDASGAVSTALSAAAKRLKASNKKGNKEDVDEVLDYTSKLEDLSEKIQNRNKKAKEKYSQKITDVISRLEDTDSLEGLPEEVKSKVKNIKRESINSQLNSLRGLAEENPQKAAEIYSKASKTFADKFKQEAEREKDSKDLENDAKQMQKYAEFGKEISSMAQGLKSGETEVKDLVEKATSHHVKVLQDVQEKVPPQAQKGINKALENTQRTQKGISNIPTNVGPPTGVNQSDEKQKEKSRQPGPPKQLPSQAGSDNKQEADKEQAGPPEQVPTQSGSKEKKEVDKEKSPQQGSSSKQGGEETEQQQQKNEAEQNQVSKKDKDQEQTSPPADAGGNSPSGY